MFIIAEEIKCGIYCIKNLVNGKVYIGQSINIKRRIKDHFVRAFSCNKSNDEYDKPLGRAIRKYGKENFEVTIIEECEKEKLNEREIYWIKFYNSTDKECGYNLSEGGEQSSYSILKKQEISEIIDLLQFSTIPITEIADYYKVAISTISEINHGHIWINKELNYPLRMPHRKPIKIKELSKYELVTKEILLEDLKTLSETELLSKYNTSKNGLKHLRLKFGIKRKDYDSEYSKMNYCEYCGKPIGKNRIYCSVQCAQIDKKIKRQNVLIKMGITKEFLEFALRNTNSISDAAKCVQMKRTPFRDACKTFGIPGIK